MMPFPDKGIMRAARALFFNPKRTEHRNNELNELCRDVDYLVRELERMEKRTGVSSLVSTELRQFQVQLRFWEERVLYPSDRAQFHAISKELRIEISSVRKMITNPLLRHQRWITEIEGGKEVLK